MFSSNEELYDFIQELIVHLVNIGDQYTAEKLERALFISSVVTEVFLTLRVELLALKDSHNLSIDWQRKIDEAIGTIGVSVR